MRGVILNCKKMEYKDLRASETLASRRVDLTSASYEDSVVVLTCIEDGDGEVCIENASRRIILLNEQFYCKKKVVLLPFAHLSKKLAKHEDAVGLISKLAGKLELLGYETAVATFGTNKEVLLHLTEELGSSSYFEF